MLDGAHIAHHVPGRVRIKIPAARRNRRVLEQVSQFISALEGVHTVEPNPVTGSVVVHYDPAHRERLYQYLPAPPELGEAAEMVEKVQREAEFLAAHSHTAAAVLESARSLDGTVRQATGGLLDLKVLLPALLTAWAFFEVGIDTSTPMWVSLGIFSFNSFVMLHRPVPIRSTVVEGSEQPKE